MLSEPARICSLHENATPGEAARASLQRRSDAVAACLSALPTDLPWTFLAELAPMLQATDLRELPAAADELGLRSDLLAGIARGVDPANPLGFARCLSAAMFHFFPHRVPRTPLPSQLALWIRIPYLKWSLSLPDYFCQIEEAERHSQWLEEWIKALTIEFGEGRIVEDLPEYQRLRLRRQVAQDVAALQLHFQAGDPPSLSEARVLSMQSALEALATLLKDEGKRT